MIDYFDDFDTQLTLEEELDYYAGWEEDDEIVSTRSYPTCYNDYSLWSDD